MEKQTTGDDAFGARSSLKVGLIRIERKLTGIKAGEIGPVPGFWVSHVSSKNGEDARRFFVPAPRVAAVEVD